MTFIEVLVSVVLMGTGVIVVLTAIQATTIATTVERDHARSLEWLQSASEVLVNEAPWQPCSVSAAAAKSAYENFLRQPRVPSIVPANWAPSQISIEGAVRYGSISGDYGTACAPAIERQLVTLRVQDLEGEIVESLDVVLVP